MASVTPPLHTLRPATPGEHLEVEVLARLANGLPDAYALVHGVDWAQSRPSGDRFGELDIVVVNAAGDVAVLEVKAGEVHGRDGALYKRYGTEEKDVTRQVSRQFGAILDRLTRAGLDVRLQHFLVLPHQRVGEEETAAWPRQRILDQDDCQDLVGSVQNKLGRGLPAPEMRERVCAFMDNRLSTLTDVGSVDRQLQVVTQRISGGLADWVPRIHAPSGVIRVTATAGSGKTQLGLRLLREARAQGRRAAYVCYNRPLADHIRELAPGGVDVATFHQWCWVAGGRPKGALDFQALAAAFCASTEGGKGYQLLVIDEVQDLQLDWVAALLRHVTPDGQLVLMDDPAQCLYDDREELEVPDAVIVTASENFRSPRRVVEVINALALVDPPVVACSPFDGDLPDVRTWPAAQGPVRVSVAAVQSCLDRGFAPGDIVVVTWRGRERSALGGERLGEWTLSRFTGGYDERGAPVWSDGALRMETLRRIKGQSAAAVVFTEIDFKALGDAERRMLFVGMTRARMHLVLVMSERAESALMKAMQ